MLQQREDRVRPPCDMCNERPAVDDDGLCYECRTVEPDLKLDSYERLTRYGLNG